MKPLVLTITLCIAVKRTGYGCHSKRECVRGLIMFGGCRKGLLCFRFCIKRICYTFSTCISLLYNWYWASFPGIKWPGRGVDHRGIAVPTKGTAIPLLPLSAKMACSRVNFAFYFFFLPLPYALSAFLAQDYAQVGPQNLFLHWTQK